jgi:hypothetical protein
MKMTAEKRTAIAAILYLLVFCVLFFEPIRQGKGVSAYDLSFFFSNYAYLQTPGRRPSNPLLEDQVTQFEPWREYARKEVRAGRIPWMDPFQGGGLPLIGNLQSAVFYPTELLSYALPRNMASLAGVMLRLLCAALGTFLLLRALHVSVGVAWLGGMMFALCGFNIVWLGHPHTNSSILLPWLMLLLLRSSRQPLAVRNFVWIAILVALLIFGGHPGTIMHVLLASAAFAVFVLLRRRTGRLRLSAFWTGAAFAGMLLAAVQLVPFVQYLSTSAGLQMRSTSGVAAFTPIRVLLTWLVPNAFGTPRDSNSHFVMPTLHFPAAFSRFDPWIAGETNFNEGTAGYAGSLFLLAAPFAFLQRRRRPLLIWIWGMMALCFFIIFQVYPVWNLFDQLPAFHQTNNGRLQLVWALLVILSGALAFDYFLGIRSRLKPTALPRVTGVLFLLAVICGFSAVVAWLIPLEDASPIQQLVSQLAIFGVVLAAALFSYALFLRRVLPRAGLIVILAMAMGAEAMNYAKDYNPAYDLNQRYPVTPGLAFLQHQPNSATDWVLFLEGTFPPDLATVYGIHDLRAYDGMEARNFKATLQALFGIETSRENIRFVPDLSFISSAERDLKLHIGFVALPAHGKLTAQAREKFAGLPVFEGPDLIVYSLPRSVH